MTHSLKRKKIFLLLGIILLVVFFIWRMIRPMNIFVVSEDTIKKKTYKLKRTILWRPFIFDLRDTRLKKDKPRAFTFKWKIDSTQDDIFLDIIVRYHLLDEARKKRIGYRNSDPISFVLYRSSTPIP
ncbi:MAG: hypothetical protein L3J49_12660 [Desulfobulbaceae bacterium]|nr:hypothetical protein [Desulfobulbaceae bacterium]